MDTQRKTGKTGLRSPCIEQLAFVEFYEHAGDHIPLTNHERVPLSVDKPIYALHTARNRAVYPAFRTVLLKVNRR